MSLQLCSTFVSLFFPRQTDVSELTTKLRLSNIKDTSTVITKYCLTIKTNDAVNAAHLPIWNQAKHQYTDVDIFLVAVAWSVASVWPSCGRTALRLWSVWSGGQEATHRLNVTIRWCQGCCMWVIWPNHSIPDGHMIYLSKLVWLSYQWEINQC